MFFHNYFCYFIFTSINNNVEEETSQKELKQEEQKLREVARQLSTCFNSPNRPERTEEEKQAIHEVAEKLKSNLSKEDKMFVEVMATIWEQEEQNNRNAIIARADHYAAEFKNRGLETFGELIEAGEKVKKTAEENFEKEQSRTNFIELKGITLLLKTYNSMFGEELSNHILFIPSSDDEEEEEKKE